MRYTDASGISVLWTLLRCMLFGITCVVAACTPADSALKPAIVPTRSSAIVRLTVSGSEDVTAILEAASTSFTDSIPGYHLRILSGSGIAPSIKGVLEGVLDIAAMNRLPTPDEEAQGLRFLKFGQASVVMFVHPSVPIDNLTSEQAKAIFTGKITNWSQVSGPDTAVIVYVRNEENGNTQVLRKGILGNISFPDSVEVLNRGDNMRTAVAVTGGSIGYGAWPPVLATGVNVKPLALDGIKPNEAHYPLISVFGIGYLDSRSSKIQPLINWLQSKAGQEKLAEFGVVVIQ